MHNNLSDYYNVVLSKISVRLPKMFWSPNCLLHLIETIQKFRDNHGIFSVVMTDLSKAFDCISHELLIVKLNAYDLMKLH